MDRASNAFGGSACAALQLTGSADASFRTRISPSHAGHDGDGILPGVAIKREARERRKALLFAPPCRRGWRRCCERSMRRAWSRRPSQASIRRCSKRFPASPLVDLAPVVATGPAPTTNSPSKCWTLGSALFRLGARRLELRGAARRSSAVCSRAAIVGLLCRARFHSLVAGRVRAGAIGSRGRAPAAPSRARMALTFPLTRFRPSTAGARDSVDEFALTEAVGAYAMQVAGGRIDPSAHFSRSIGARPTQPGHRRHALTRAAAAGDGADDTSKRIQSAALRLPAVAREAHGAPLASRARRH